MRGVWLGLLVVLGAMVARADDPSPGEIRGREVGGHMFTPSRLVRDAFTPTAFITSTAFAYGTATGADFNAGGLLTTTRDYDVAGYTESFEFQLRLWEWLSLRAGANGLVFTGTSAAAVLIAGTSAQVGTNVGLTAARNFGDNLRLGFVLDAGYQPSYDLLVANAILADIASGQLSDADALQRTNTWTFSPGISGALGLGKFIGLQATLRYTHPRRDQNDTITNVNAITAGGAIDLDFNRISPFPVALLGQYRITAPWTDNEANDQEGGAGLYYTARKELVLGVDYTWRKLRVRSGLDVTAPIVTINFRYDWH